MEFFASVVLTVNLIWDISSFKPHFWPSLLLVGQHLDHKGKLDKNSTGATSNIPLRPSAFFIAKDLIRRTITDPPINRAWPVMTCENFFRKAFSNQADAVLLVRLRSGCTPLLKVYAQLSSPAADSACPLCIEEPQTVEQWQQRCTNFDVLQ